MTFTYTVSDDPTDSTLVRYYIGDRDEDTAWFTDEEISMVIAVEGTYQAACVSLLRQILTEIAREPDLKADWLATNWGSSLKALKERLAELKATMGVESSRTGSAVATYRSDSLQTEAPDW